jgi:microcystin-dependent protein
MPYIVNFTDKDNKSPITVFDNTSSTDTSLTFPGRNVTGYGQIIAENFLALLENFASEKEPVNPVEGQLWYDSNNKVLQIWDNTNWKAASGVQKSSTEPALDESKVGELWVDTTNQQLRIYTGSRWLLVGPSESSIDGLRYGPSIEKISDTDNITRVILSFYIADVPVIIFSKDSFTPKVSISGFLNIKSGININIPGTSEDRNNFFGTFLPKLYGTAQAADSLVVSGTEVAAGKFLRSDTVNTVEEPFNVRSNSGITLGVDGTFEISTTPTAAKIYNKTSGSSLDLQVNRNGIANTILRVLDNNIGINKLVPEQALDVVGNIATTGSVIISNATESTNLNNGSIRTAGGMAINKNLLIGTDLSVTGFTTTGNVQPRTTDSFDCGTALKRWNTIRAKRILADEIQGVLNGNINGNANSATNLKNVTTFQLEGDVVSLPISFDGQVGSYTKIFDTSLTANIIKGKSEPSISPGDNRARSLRDDYVLTYRPSAEISGSSGLLKQTRDTFVGDLGVPIGGIMPYAGNNVPYGYLLCDGSEVERSKYPNLYDVIGNTYSRTTVLAGNFVVGQTYTIFFVGTTDFTLIGASSNSVDVTFIATGSGNGSGVAFTSSFVGVNTFRLPDLRGRFPLGRDNMDNGITVPNSIGGYVDAGGGNIDRVPDTRADILGASAGQSSVGLTLGNLPEHTHTLRNGNKEFAAILVDTAISPPATTGLGPTAPGQAQYLRDSGPVRKPDDSFTLGNPIGLMNPYLTINYIIRSGPPAFITVPNS